MNSVECACFRSQSLRGEVAGGVYAVRSLDGVAGVEGDGLLHSAVVLVGDATGGKGHAPGLADASELCQDNERVEIEMGREQ
eukprot:CAMPEP_0179459926 /NCGR_PEP_ID=MMETSP0799-20121207/43141_1 /TAXON_ID=46947 /ORGANISM="Geminigera cryophila, Strain CCMP2564" /LENGTH=81 /DNA_ID=CAMNT_0021261995 /DNA_START=250 /DNA_END=495 /DNA_ORIENTATION=-